MSSHFVEGLLSVVGCGTRQCEGCADSLIAFRDRCFWCKEIEGVWSSSCAAVNAFKGTLALSPVLATVGGYFPYIAPVIASLLAFRSIRAKSRVRLF